MGHLARMCWKPGGGEYWAPGENTNEISFPGVYGSGMRRPPCPDEPHEYTLIDGAEVKWCTLWKLG